MLHPARAFFISPAVGSLKQLPISILTALQAKPVRPSAPARDVSPPPPRGPARDLFPFVMPQAREVPVNGTESLFLLVNQGSKLDSTLPFP